MASGMECVTNSSRNGASAPTRERSSRQAATTARACARTNFGDSAKAPTLSNRTRPSMPDSARSRSSRYCRQLEYEE